MSLERMKRVIGIRIGLLLFSGHIMPRSRSPHVGYPLLRPGPVAGRQGSALAGTGARICEPKSASEKIGNMLDV